jgi:hypothetical protein
MKRVPFLLVAAENQNNPVEAPENNQIPQRKKTRWASVPLSLSTPNLYTQKT